MERQGNHIFQQRWNTSKLFILQIGISLKLLTTLLAIILNHVACKSAYYIFPALICLVKGEFIKAFLSLCLFLIQIYLEFKDLGKFKGVNVMENTDIFRALLMEYYTYIFCWGFFWTRNTLFRTIPFSTFFSIIKVSFNNSDSHTSVQQCKSSYIKIPIEYLQRACVLLSYWIHFALGKWLPPGLPKNPDWLEYY